MEYTLIINPTKEKNYPERYKAVLLWKGETDEDSGLSKGYPKTMELEEILNHVSNEVEEYTGSNNLNLIVN